MARQDSDRSLPCLHRQSLKDKVAVISGSHGGLGAQIARELSESGAKIVLNYPSSTRRDRANTVLNSLHTPAIAVEADISTTTGPQILINAAVAAFEVIDILVNNAGKTVDLPFEEQTLEHWETLVNVNGRGTFLLTQAALPHLSPQGSRIINISSISAKEGMGMQTLLSGTKAMIESFTKVWAKELPPKYHCTVNCVSPGPTRTEAFGAALAGAEFQRIINPLIEGTPVANRPAETSEISYAVLMLCHPRATWLNGVNLIVSGGLGV
ncbi:hypothetical protein BDV23DRAFT_167448 [Aspergillus alliaceus]|uniref:Uncharacterized protein n=1 Tax=Petromyces alliaceus TaxID=209559 RepID=A0A5N7BRL3_PETAA|nr:uncharacterized protein BDW43DRAFT_322517 [Aspergillus alliaceus]KAB8228843.1 hypothetical protein BDW43DRAFT_322517 [Aspergillus alliaceus]KAE8384157.1 hypothetical protein BDV23DRAFT_167448 [Aspergillus alliaceus]